jgi:hypothetical protein
MFYSATRLARQLHLDWQPTLCAREASIAASTGGWAAMKTNRMWIEIVLLGSAIACGLALLLATLGAAAGAAAGEVGARPANTTEQTYEGMVSCSRCGAKHSAELGQAASTCTRTCVNGGANFALVDSDATYLLDGDLNLLKKLAGQRAHVVGALHGQTIRISSVTPAT